MSTDKNAKVIPKSSNKKVAATASVPTVVPVDPSECPFREFRDNELQQEYWGMGPSTFKVYSAMGKGAGLPKQPHDYVWEDDQTQPLPRSVRQYLHGYQRAIELAMTRWKADVVVFEENNNSRMSVADMQLSHAQVLNRSSFCRQVLSACFILERTANFIVEHQWEHFTCILGPEGWRAKYHIYSPGMKPGAGSQHRPTLSKTGCYLVRLYYLGAWRCVWVTDQVPVDATDSPLLPFSPLLSRATPVKGAKQVPTTTTSNAVFLWPLLICKALLKLAVPDMNSDENGECVDDELMPEFDILHALTGALNMSYRVTDIESLWSLITKEVPMFSWDDDDETQASTVRSKSTKKSTTKDLTAVKRSRNLVYVNITETKDYPPYFLPGITPSFEMSLLVTMARDLPLKKPLPEPELPLWKTYRWIYWARHHGLYDAYDCPRTKYVKVNGLLKLSFAPHLLDVVSTESLTVGFVKTERSGKEGLAKDKKSKDTKAAANTSGPTPAHLQEELREWMLFNAVHEVTKSAYTLYYPSMYECASATSNPIIRMTKGVASKILEVHASKSAPLYLQIDGPEVNNLKISLNVLHPRVLFNAGVFVIDYVESGYLVVERFEWFKDCELPKPKAFVRTCGYDAVEVSFVPGRHFCRVWVHSRMNWHILLLSESTLYLGPRDQIQVAATRECPWVSKFLLNLGTAFFNWLKATRSTYSLRTLQTTDREFFKSYLPDLPWDNEAVGYNRYLLHWMFRQALQSHMFKKVAPADLPVVLPVLRAYFRDPDLGFPPKPVPNYLSPKDIADTDPCDCVLPEYEEVDVESQDKEETEQQELEGQDTIEKVLVPTAVMDKLLKPPVSPVVSNVCELATEEVPCEILKEERNKVIRKHIAATTIQAFWRGTWARMCLSVLAAVSADTLKILQDAVFGNQESLSSLMKEFFLLYPETKYSYSVASGLSGIYGLRQHNGTSQVTSKCKWIPYFQGVFYCHVPCKVHFDVTGSLHHSMVEVYDNDTKEKLPQAYSAHKTFDFNQNIYGYTVLGHGSISEAPGYFFDASWQLTVFSSLDGAFHICNNDDECREMHLYSATKLHLDEIYIPNRRNILGGIQLSVTRHEAVSFRAAATSPDLEMVAQLRTVADDGSIEELASCAGKGEIYWPYIRLDPAPPKEMGAAMHSTSARSLTKQKSRPGTRQLRSTSKLKVLPTAPAEPKKYLLEVVAPNGWPLTIGQWTRVDEIRNSPELLKADYTSKKVVIKEKATSKPTKDKSDKMPAIPAQQPQPGDAYVELECSSAVLGGILVRRDDERELKFLNARKSWEEMEPGRNKRGAQIRKEFRDEFLVLPPTPFESHPTTTDDLTNYEGEGEYFEDNFKMSEFVKVPQDPSPTTEDGYTEMSVEVEEEMKYLLMPDQLRDKFVPLSFVPLCTKELSEDECVVLTDDMIEAAKQARHLRIEAAIDRMYELQQYNEVHVLGRQRNRQMLLEKLYVDAILPPELVQVLHERNEAIVQEQALRSMSATKKKQDAKGKEVKGKEVKGKEVKGKK